MADISKIMLPSGNTYDIKDQTARDAIAALEGGSYFLGLTTTVLSNNSTTNPITIDGESVTAKNGSIAVYGNAEFIFNGTKWIEFGDLSSLGALAYKDSVALDKGSGDNVLGEATTFTNGSSSVTFSGGTTDSVLGASTTFAVTQPTVTVTPSTGSVPNVTSVGSASSWKFAMGSGTAAETLVISGDNSTTPTLGTAVGVVTGISSATASGTSVSANSDDNVTAVTGIGTGTAAAQTITVGTNDKVKVAKYADLDVTVS